MKVGKTDERVIFVMVSSLSCAYVLRFGSMEFQRWAVKMRKKRLQNLILDVRGGSEGQRYSDDRVLPDGLTFMRL